MKITILEDRPTVMKEAIKKMETLGIHTAGIVCYKNADNQSPETQKLIQKTCSELKVELCYVDNSNFHTVLDSIYKKDREMVFLFDMDMIGDFSQHFEERINVIYALKKKAEEGDDGRIWFYTTGPASAVEQINKKFPNRNIPVPEFDVKEKQVVFDYNFIEKAMCKKG